MPPDVADGVEGVLGHEPRLDPIDVDLYRDHQGAVGARSVVRDHHL